MIPDPSQKAKTIDEGSMVAPSQLARPALVLVPEVHRGWRCRLNEQSLTTRVKNHSATNVRGILSSPCGDVWRRNGLAL